MVFFPKRKKKKKKNWGKLQEHIVFLCVFIFPACVGQNVSSEEETAPVLNNYLG